MLGMTDHDIKRVIDYECFGLSATIHDQTLQAILARMSSAVAKAISDNNQAIERGLKQAIERELRNLRI